MLHPDTPPYDRRMLDVGDGHALCVRQFGRPDGLPALALHGGPGSGSAPLLWRVFDPAVWRVVCVDQRGAGLSTPRGLIAHNTLGHLLDDLRRVRAHLGLERALVVGGSWGATLALAHAADQPDGVAALLLRGAFVARGRDIHAFFQPPDAAGTPAWQALADAAPPAAREALLAWLHDVLTRGDAPAQAHAARTWWRWESARSGWPAADPPVDGLIDRYRVQAHYLVHGCFLRERPLLARCEAVPPVPTRLLHGRDDRVCPLDGAQALQRALPQARLQVIDGVGHDAAHPALVDALMHALDAYAQHGRFDP